MSNEIILDGKKSGVVIYMKNRNDFLKVGNNKTKMFANIDSACAYAYAKGARTRRDFKLYFVIGSNAYKIDNSEMIDIDTHQLYVKEEGMKKFRSYTLKETHERTITSLGYIIFDHGDDGKRHNPNKMPKLIRMMSSKLSELNTGTVRSVVDGDGIEVSYEHSTVRLEIVSNQYMMNLNKIRREGMDKVPKCYWRSIPFLRNMDNYTTFYSYLIFDDAEPKANVHFYSDLAEHLRASMVEELKAKWTPVQYMGTIKE